MTTMSSSCSTAIFFANAPNLNELCTVTLQICENETSSVQNQDQDTQSKLPAAQFRSSQRHSQFSQMVNGNNNRSHYSQPQIIKCRELIFTERDIIGTPSLNHEKKLQIVMQQSLYKSGRLQSRFNKMGLQAEKPLRVTPALFNSCLRYTVEARLAPSWNRVGQYLVQGRDFLLSRQSLNSIKMELTANEKEFYLSVEAKNIKLPPIRLEDLEIPQPVRDRFSSKSDDVIQEYSIENNWCYVLPSMKQGKVVYICHKLPDYGPFRSYKDIKRHWKNSYGYRLPEDEEGVIYYQIYFKLIGERLFTYPECCVRPRDIHVVPRTDPKPIIQTFLSDLQNKISNICGQKFHFQTKASFLVTSLNEICKEGTSRSNLTAKMPTPKAAYRPGPTTAPALLTKPLKYTKETNQETLTAINHQSANSQQSSTQFNERKTFENKNMQICPVGTRIRGENDQNNNEDAALSHRQQDLDVVTVTASSRPRIIPMFNSVKPATGRVIINHNVDKAQPKTVPIFRAKVPSLGARSMSTGPKPQPFSRNAVTQPITAEEPPKNMFQPSNPNNSCQNLSRISQFDTLPNNPSQPCFSSRNKSTKCPIFAKHPQATSTSSSGKTTQPQTPRPKLLGQTSTPGSKLRLKKVAASPANMNNMNMKKPTAPPQMLTDPGSLQGPGGYLNDSQSSMQSLSSVLNTPLKRKNLPQQAVHDVDGASKAKKPRAKQTVQEGMDVTLLANNNQLNKANAATLTAWLKSRGIVCKAKDKKTDLVEKVKTALNIVSVEQ